MEPNNLIDAFKAANQSLRKRAITIGVLMMIAVALRYSENKRMEKVLDLLQYECYLDAVYRLPENTFKKLINGEEEVHLECLPPISGEDDGYLFEKIKMADYKRGLLLTAITETEREIDNFNKEQSIGILGITIPFEPVAYLSLVFILIIFHDFTQVFVFRNQVYRRIQKGIKHPWELGIEFFGFYHNRKNPGVRFLKFASVIITSALILCPALTGYLMLQLNPFRNNTFTIINLLCFVIIVIDTLIIFHTENILNFRYACNWYLGKHNTDMWMVKWSWFMTLLLMLTFGLGIGWAVYMNYGAIGIYISLLGLIPPIPLYIFLRITHKRPTVLHRSIRAGLLVLNVFWLYTLLHDLLLLDEWTFYAVERLGAVLFFATLFSAVFALAYGKRFISQRTRRNRRIPPLNR